MFMRKFPRLCPVFVPSNMPIILCPCRPVHPYLVPRMPLTLFYSLPIIPDYGVITLTIIRDYYSREWGKHCTRLLYQSRLWTEILTKLFLDGSLWGPRFDPWRTLYPCISIRFSVDFRWRKWSAAVFSWSYIIRMHPSFSFVPMVAVYMVVDMLVSVCRCLSVFRVFTSGGCVCSGVREDE